MKDWALEKGATHYTHLFQPMTGLTAEKHDSFLAPTGDGHRARRVQRQGTRQGRAGRLARFPSGGIRATFEARGYTAWDPTSPAYILENPNGAHARHPDRVRVLDRRGARQEDPAAPLDGGAVSTQAMRILRLFGNTTPSRCSPPSAPSRNTS